MDLSKRKVSWNWYSSVLLRLLGVYYIYPKFHQTTNKQEEKKCKSFKAFPEHRSVLTQNLEKTMRWVLDSERRKDKANQGGLLAVCMIWHDCKINQGRVWTLIPRSGPEEDKNRASPSACPLLNTHTHSGSLDLPVFTHCTVGHISSPFCCLSIGLFFLTFDCVLLQRGRSNIQGQLKVNCT